MSARLLKNDCEVAGQSCVPFDYPEHDGDLTHTSHRLGVTHADPQTEAAGIIETARARAAEIEQEVLGNMTATVRANVEAEISSVINPWRDQLLKSLDELTKLRSETAQQAEQELVRLALEIARTVIHGEVHNGNEVATQLARVALSRIPNRTPATVHLNPEDLAYVEAIQDQLQTNHALTFVADRSIGRGGCLIQTEIGDVDATIEHQFDEVQQAILGN